MKTVVYQSYRTDYVPTWIGRCLSSVQAWAKENQYDYVFIDDSFFDCLPEWYKEKVEGDKCLLSDLSRLYTARRLIEAGYERTIWVDADVIVFHSPNFVIPIHSNYFFCRETWVEKKKWGRFSIREKVNNAIAVFTKGSNDFLEFYINACITIVREKKGRPAKIDIGTIFLTNLYSQLQFPLLNNVGLFSPVVMNAILTEEGNTLRRYSQAYGYPIAAANLCSSFRGKEISNVQMSDDLYDEVIDNLMHTNGSIINQYCQEGKSWGTKICCRLFQ